MSVHLLPVQGARLTGLFILLLSLVCSGPREPLLVSAAASLEQVMTELAALHSSRGGDRIQLNIAASGLLQRQIEAGAPVDVFISAGDLQMDALQAGGLILAETRRAVAGNSLAVVVPAVRGGTLASLRNLADPGFRRLALGNPRTVPAGQYAVQALKSSGIWERIEPRVVPSEDVRQVLDYVARGEAEAGIVFATDVSRARGRASLALRVPSDQHDPIRYPAAVVRASTMRARAERFLDFLLSSEARQVLARHGFERPR